MKKRQVFAISHTCVFGVFIVFLVNHWFKILENHFVLLGAVNDTTFYHKNHIFAKKFT